MIKKTLVFVVSALALASCSEGAQNTARTYVPTVSKEIESATFGASESKANLVIFTDYQCPACQFFNEVIGPKLKKEYVETKKVSLTYKNYPLPMHRNAEGDAVAALCALSNGKYLEYADGLYALEKSKANSAVTDAERIDLATKNGMDAAEFGKCMNEGWYVKKLASEKAEGDALGLRGTPSSYLNGKLMEFRSAEEYFAMLDAALAK